MAKVKKKTGEKSAVGKAEKVLQEAGKALADGSGVREEKEETLSPEQQAVSGMGEKTKQVAAALVGEGKKLVKGELQRRGDRQEPSPAEGTAAEPATPEALRGPARPVPGRRPPAPEEESLSLLESRDEPEAFREADLERIPEGLAEKSENIQNSGQVRRAEGSPEPVRPVSASQEMDDGSGLRTLENDGLDLRQELVPEILTEHVDSQAGEIAFGDVGIQEEDQAPAREMPKTGTGSGTGDSAGLPGRRNRDTGSGEREAFSPSGRAGRQEKSASERSLPETRQKKRDEDSRFSIKTREVDESTLKVGGGAPIRTGENTAATYGIQTQNTPLAAMGGEQALKTVGQEAGQVAGQAGTSAATGAATGGVSVAVQVGEKVVEKIKETIQTAVQIARESPKAIGGIAALFFLPLAAAVVLLGAIGGGRGSASNQNLSEGVLALMPQIVEACQERGIPEYAPLVAAVMMQESGGNVELVNGDVMMCAEAMGYPVFTPVPVDESIRYGTGLIADLLEQAGAQGPDDLQNIKLALQSYNYGPGYLTWVQENHGGQYSRENAAEFAAMMAHQMGWSGYGDEEYVDHVLRYYTVDSFGLLTGDSAIEDGFFAYPCEDHPWDTYGGHEGIDISWGGCSGEPIYAVADGVVSYTHDGWTPTEGYSGIRSYGNTVWVSHSNGWQSRYGHMSAVAVESGTYVLQGQLLGYIGSTGNSSGPHLHLALYDPSGNPFSGSRNWAEIAWPQYGG